MIPLLDYQSAAAILGCSRSLVADMALAATYAGDLKAGRRKLEDVPPRLRRYLQEGFPVPIIIGERIKRIDQNDFSDYLKNRKLSLRLQR